MADLNFSATINDQGFQAGIKRMEKGVQDFAKTFKFLAVGQAAIKGFEILDNATREFAKENSLAAEAIRNLDRAQASLNKTLGEGGVGLVQAKAGVIGLMDAALQAAVPIQDKLADLLGGMLGGEGTSAEKAAARAGSKEMDAQVQLNKAKAEASKLAEKRLEEVDKELNMMAAIAAGTDDQLKASRERVKFEKDLREATAGLVEELKQKVDIEATMKVYDDLALKALQEKADLEMQARIDEYDKANQAAQAEADAHRAATDALNVQMSGLEVDRLKAQGRDEDAIRLQKVIELEKMRLEIEKDQNLTAQEKAEYIDRIGSSMMENARLEEAQRQKDADDKAAQDAAKDGAFGRSRATSAGVTGSSRFMDAVLGRSGGGITVQQYKPLTDRQDKQLKETSMGVEILRRIESKLGISTGAVFA